VLNLAQHSRIRVLADRIGLESVDREGTAVVLRFRQDAPVHPGVLARLLQTRGDLVMLPPAVLRLDLAKPVDALAARPRPPARPPTPKVTPAVPPGRKAGPPPKASDDDDVSGSWWTTRATSEVVPGFNREIMLAEVPPDPAAPGGLFERLGDVLDQLSQSMITG
jgi:hypothetical protein